MEYLTPMLTLGLRSYESSNLVLDLKMREKLELKLPVCKIEWGGVYFWGGGSNLNLRL